MLIAQDFQIFSLSIYIGELIHFNIYNNKDLSFNSNNLYIFGKNNDYTQILIIIDFYLFSGSSELLPETTFCSSRHETLLFNS